MFPKKRSAERRTGKNGEFGRPGVDGSIVGIHKDSKVVVSFWNPFDIDQSFLGCYRHCMRKGGEREKDERVEQDRMGA